MQVLERFQRTIREHGLLRPDTRVIAAVSGGSDSVALAHLLRALDDQGEARLVGVVHFNHQLRPSAGDEERVAAAVAAAVGRPFLAERDDVAALARRERRSLEDAARTARYACFARGRERFGADVVALGHTRDDQAETFLLRLLRGAGPRGLAAMYPRNGAVVRPLLDCRRADLRAWLGERKIRFVDDESNADVAIPRNRIRGELIPLLQARFNPAIVDVLADEAAVDREAWQAIEAMADEIASRIVKATDSGYEVDVRGLLAVALPLRRVVMWRTMGKAAGLRPVGFGHVGDVLKMIETDGPAVLDFPGHRVERIAGRLVLRERRHQRPPNRTNLFEYPLSIPGAVEVAEAGCVVSAEPLRGNASDVADPGAVSGNGPVALVSAELCRTKLSVRNRRPGDRFRPVGLGGRKKVHDVFVDRKVARAERDAVPIVVDDAGRIVWVAGHGIDEAFRVTNAAQAVLLLRLRPAGGIA